MPKKYSSTTIGTAALLAVCALFGSACGGSAEFSAGSGGTAGTAAGGFSNAGKGGDNSCASVACTAIGCGPGYKSVREAGSCCPTCVPDGSGGTGGGDSCANVNCLTIDCALGYTSVRAAGACCPSCVPDGSGGGGAGMGGGNGGGGGCTGHECPPSPCAKGYKYQSVPGQCCGTCVPDPQACTDGQAEYQALRKQLLTTPGTLSCSTSADCTFLSNNAYCGDQCSSSPVNVQAAKDIDQQLSQLAAERCSTCTPIYPPCAAPQAPFCAGNTCTLGGYL